MREFTHPCATIALLVVATATLSLAAPPRANAATALELATAMSVDPSLITGTTALSGDPQASAVLTSLGVLMPENGSDFAVLSTGVVGAAHAEPGTDFGAVGEPGDEEVLEFTVNVPAGANRMSFSYIFLTAEYPEHIFAPRDSFTAELTDAMGTQTIATSDVSLTLSVSRTAADGTGYDLFTQDASGEDSDFGDGHYAQADAAILISRGVVVPISGSTATLRFTIRDGVDGLLDSAVVLDRLFFGFLEAADPNPDLLNEEGEIVTDPEELDSEGDTSRGRGAGADGVTEVLLRTKVSGTGDVEFCLAGASTFPGDGGIRLVDSATLGDCATAAVQTTAAGDFAFAVYRAPNDFDEGSEQSLREREIGIDTTFMPDVGLDQQSHLPFLLTRPPLILVHGVWSSRDTWTFPLATDARYDPYLADYEPSNAKHLHDNRKVVYAAARKALSARRSDGFAVTQVDDGVHSMGGLLSRFYVQSGFYQRKQNFFAGDLHRLVTMDTPHTGSPLPDLAVTIRDTPGVGTGFAAIMRRIGTPVDEGAMDDMRVCSAVLHQLQTTPLDSFAAIGIGGGADPLASPEPLNTIFRVIDSFAPVAGLYGMAFNDFVVLQGSQASGIALAASDTFAGTDGIHTENTGSSLYSVQLDDALNPATSGDSFGNFADVASQCAGPIGNVGGPGMLGPPGGGGITIDPPLPPTSVVPGQLINVTLGGIGTLQRMWVVGHELAGTVVGPPPQVVPVSVPQDASGSLELVAYGEDIGGNFHVSAPHVMTVLLPNPDSVRLLPGDLRLRVDETAQVRLRGDFAGTFRDLTSAASQTLYRIEDTGKATVSVDGLVTALSEGTTTLIAHNELIGDSVHVIVEGPATTSPTADAGPDHTGLTGTFVPLVGSNSALGSGPGPLLHDWLQTAGPVASVSNADQALASFVPTQSGLYAFELVSFDGDGFSAPDEVLVSVGLCGNAGIDPGEQCDDGNSAPGDGCSGLCQFSGNAWVFSGTAQGGSISFSVNGVGLIVFTTNGQTAADVAAAISDEINGDPTLMARLVNALADNEKVRTNGDVSAVLITDPGISHSIEAIPVVTLGGLLVLAAALAAAARVRWTRRTGARLA